MKDKAYYRLTLVCAAALILAVAAWAKTYTLQATSIAPGATGTLEAKADKLGGNTMINLKVDHLAKPTLLTPPANEYVVWVEPQGAPAQNLGVLRVGEDEKGELKMTTTAAKFTLLVTAETEARPQKPSNRVVLRSEVQE